MLRAKSNLPVQIIEDPQIPMPLYIYVEPRRNVRISISKGNANLRLPLYLSSRQQLEYLQWAKDWIVKKYQKQPSLAEPECKTYHDGDELMLMEQIFHLKLYTHDNPNIKSSIKENIFHIYLPQIWSSEDQQLGLSMILRKMIAKKMRSDMIDRVIQLNRLHFQKDIRALRLKYNTSNWGSCSRKQNLNFSTRLLLAPLEVIDYVIIHELAHLIEMNHSSKFWAIVEKADPTYRAKEKWLKDHGRSLII
jgi:predicted metal-dependent hydrolase